MPGMQEWLIIAVLALLVFGPERLPELARTAGRFVSRLRSETQRNVDELKRMSEIQELRAELRGLEREFRDPLRAKGSRSGDGPANRAPGTTHSDRGTDPPAGTEDAGSPPTDPEAT